METNKIADGMIHLPNELTDYEKQTIYQIIWKNAKFYEDDSITPNFHSKLQTRGRDGFLIKNMKRGDEILSILSQIRDKVVSLDSQLEYPIANYVLIQFYCTKDGIKRYYDGFGGNNGDEGAPVYSLSLGNSCNFRYSLLGTNRQKGDSVDSVLLSSGDVLVFGGPQRLIPHEIKKD
jgi:hypothetical protein